MYNKVSDKIKEGMLNDSFRLIYIVLFISSIIFVTVISSNLVIGSTYKEKGVKALSERRSNKNSNTEKIKYASYKVTHKYEQLDGTYSIEDKVLNGTIDTEVTPEVITKEGYIAPLQQTVKINKDNTTMIEYVYDLEEYDLLVNDYDKVNEGNISGKYKYGTEVKLSAKEIDGYKFVKWSNDSTDKSITLVIKEKTEIGPIYEKIPEKTVPVSNKTSNKPVEQIVIYTVKLDGNGGKINNNTIKVEKGKTITSLPTPTVTDTMNIKFLGWYTSKAGGTKVSVGYKPTKDITLYARYDNKCSKFINDSLIKIASNVFNNVGYYPIGCEKTVDLDLNDDGSIDKTTKIRIVNNTLPDECFGSSQPRMACGFVVEFEEIIGRGTLSYGDNLYSKIKDNFPDVFISELTPTALYGTKNNNIHEITNTKQLDYYKKIGTTRSNSSATIKKYNGRVNDWLLLAYVNDSENDNLNFYKVGNDGKLTKSSYNTEANFGFSPAIRFFDKDSLPNACAGGCYPYNQGH